MQFLEFSSSYLPPVCTSVCIL